MSLDQRRRLFFKYEKRIRELSPPEKVRWLPIGLLVRVVACQQSPCLHVKWRQLVCQTAASSVMCASVQAAVVAGSTEGQWRSRHCSAPISNSGWQVQRPTACQLSSAAGV